MNAVFSLILSLVLIFSGSSLPAVPETAAVTSLRNVRVTLDGETVSLPHELILTTAVGMEEIGAAFEIRNGDETLLPLRGVLTADALDFAFSDAGHYFHLSDEGLAESGMLPFTKEEAQALDRLVIAALHYQEAMRIYRENYLQRFDVATRFIGALAAQAGAEAEDTQITLDGETHAARRYRFKATDADLKAAQIAMTRCGEPTIEALYRGVLGAAELMEAAGEQVYPEVLTYDVSLAEGEDWNRYKARISDASTTQQLVIAQRGDMESFSINIKQKTEHGSASFVLSGEMAGSGPAPAQGEFEFKIFMPMAYDEDIALGGNLKLDSGAWELQMQFGRALDDLRRGVALSVSAPEEIPEGAKRSVTFSAREMDFSLSFDLLSGRKDHVSFFEGWEQKTYDPASGQNVAMTSDLLVLMADAAAFAADKDVSAAKHMLENGAWKLTIDTGDFEGELPPLHIPPEGYELMHYMPLDTDASSVLLFAVYAREMKEAVVFYNYAYSGYSDMTTYELTPEGELLESGSGFVRMARDPEVNGWYANVSGASGNYDIHLQNIPDPEEAKNLIAEICTSR